MMSAHHLILARCRCHGAQSSYSSANSTGSKCNGTSTHAWTGPLWSWMPAQRVRPGDELQDAGGKAVFVQDIHQVYCRGMFGPLTIDSTLFVDGVLCSCFAPPLTWSVPHVA